MTSRTMTRADLVEALHRSGFSKTDAPQLLETVLTVIRDAVVQGQVVKLARFGNFVVRDKRERVGRNPKTGKEVPITPRRVVTFRASQLLREKVSKPR